VHLRGGTPGRAYYDRKRTEGKTKMEAIRCLKRRLSDAVYRRLADDNERCEAGPGGHFGATLVSSAVDLSPVVDTSDQPLPGPAPATLRPPIRAAKTTASPPAPSPAGAPEASTWSTRSAASMNDVDTDQRRRIVANEEGPDHRHNADERALHACN